MLVKILAKQTSSTDRSDLYTGDSGVHTDRDTGILMFCCGFPPALQANVGIVPQRKSRPVPSKSFPNICSLRLHLHHIVCSTDGAVK
jgi:hypothetical protein